MGTGCYCYGAVSFASRSVVSATLSYVDRAQVHRTAPLSVRLELENLARDHWNTYQWKSLWSHEEALQIYGRTAVLQLTTVQFRKEPNVLG